MSVLLYLCLAAGLLTSGTRPASAATGDCSQPVSSGAGPIASDCLHILRVAVGLATCDPHEPCVCAPKGSLPATAADALRCLIVAVGGAPLLNCPCMAVTTTTVPPTTSTTTTTTTTSTSTTTTLPPECIGDLDCDDGDPCNGFESCSAGECVPGEPLGCDADDIVFVMPFEGAAEPGERLVEVTTSVVSMDAYLLVDRSGSMATERSALASNVGAALQAAACPPAGTGSPPDCVEDLWVGIGSLGYSGASGEPYLNHVDLGPTLTALEASVPTTEPGGCCAETTFLALWSTINGADSASSGCSVGSSYVARATCQGSPAGINGTGYPCFRDHALRTVILLTDEQPSANFNCPAQVIVEDAARQRDVRIMSVYGSDSSVETVSELTNLAVDTDAVDASNGDAPLVFDGSGDNAPAAVQAAVESLAANALLDPVAATVLDSSGDGIDVTVEFLERVQTAQLGTAACADGLTDDDQNGDAFPETYRNLRAGSSVCWSVIARPNATISATDSAQVFLATFEVREADAAVLDARDVYFVVPPLGSTQ